MEDDAIQTDVSTEAPKEEQRPLSDREQAMLQIQQELADRYPQPEVTPVEPQEEEKPAPVATPQTVRVKVDGEEKDLTLEEVVKGYQKDSVASKRLEEAARRQRDIDAREAALAERERQIQVQVAPPPTGEEELDLTAALEAFESGDSATAASMFKEAIMKGRQPATPTINPQDIIEQAAAKVRAETEAKENARELEAFIKANPVFADEDSPERMLGDKIYDKLFAPLIVSGELSYREALEKTAEHVAGILAKPAPAPAPDPREERKKHIDNIPTASGARAAQTVKERTTDDALNDMRKWRGQAV